MLVQVYVNKSYVFFVEYVSHLSIRWTNKRTKTTKQKKRTTKTHGQKKRKKEETRFSLLLLWCVGEGFFSKTNKQHTPERKTYAVSLLTSSKFFAHCHCSIPYVESLSPSLKHKSLSFRPRPSTVPHISCLISTKETLLLVFFAFFVVSVIDRVEEKKKKREK